MHKEVTTHKKSAQSNTNHAKRVILIFLAATAIFIGATVSPLKDSSKTFTVVLDAGHGGKDPGNIGTGRYKRTEKDVSLEVVTKLGNYIKENHPDVEIVYTRTGDTYPTLNDRVVLANKVKADLFISVHCNANDNKAAYGSETFVMGLHKSEESLKSAMRENASIYLEDNYEKNYAGFDPKNPDTYIALSLRENVFLDQSLTLAKGVQDQFRDRVGRKDRGVKQAGFYVIAYTNMPSILVELGFLTNKEEEDFLHSDDGKVYLSSAIYRAFKEFKDKADKKAGKSTQPTNNQETAPITNTPKPDQKSNNEVVYNDVAKGVKFQVQILTSSKPLDKKSSEFKGLDKVDEYLSGSVYKYMAGSTSSFQEAKDMQKNLREMGFKDAFIVAFENGERIDLSEAIRKTTN
ncbi:MAG: N-acetylmuramoyl-L-alanine amidase [Flavobacteriales bacterium]